MFVDQNGLVHITYHTFVHGQVKGRHMLLLPTCMLCELMLCMCACLHVVAWSGSQYSSIAEEIRSVASSDPVHRKLFVRGLAWNTTSETLCAVSVLLTADCGLWFVWYRWLAHIICVLAILTHRSNIVFTCSLLMLYCLQIFWDSYTHREEQYILNYALDFFI